MSRKSNRRPGIAPAVGPEGFGSDDAGRPGPVTVFELQDSVDEGQKGCEKGVGSHWATAATHQRGQGREWMIEGRRSGKLVQVLFVQGSYCQSNRWSLL